MDIYHNAHIYTLDMSYPVASAFVVECDKIVAVGKDDQLLVEYGKAVKHDMEGCFILPGITDAHMHVQQYSLSLEKVDCETASLSDCLHQIEQRVQASQPGEWILGHGWNQNDWDAWPTRDDLDTIAQENPVYLTAKSLHAAWVNSCALRDAGITVETPDPENGHLLRDSKGIPTGVLLEKAMDMVSKIIPEPTVEAVAASIEQAQPALWRMGLTAIHDFDHRTCFAALQKLHAQGKLKLRVLKSVPIDDLSHAKKLGLRTGFGDDWLRVGPIKVFMDGALGPRTAAMFQPYQNEAENHGILNMEADELFELGRQAVESGLSLAVHAIGDYAIHEVLNAFEKLRQFERGENKDLLRHRIEHVQIIRPDDAKRFSELGIIASMQPIHATSDMRMAERYWGNRSQYSYAWKTQLRNGSILAFGSDAPVESPNPFWGVHAAVTRQRADGTPGPDGWIPQERLSISEALSGYTYGPAFASGLEDRFGKISSGCLADLIVLDQDPFEISPDAIRELVPLATMIGGEWVWQS